MSQHLNLLNTVFKVALHSLCWALKCPTIGGAEKMKMSGMNSKYLQAGDDLNNDSAAATLCCLMQHNNIAKY